MTMQTDWIGEWFGILEEMGENVDLLCGQFEPKAERVAWSRLSHRDFDGLGALLEMIERLGGRVEQLPTYQGRKLGLVDRARAFVRYSRSRPVLVNTRDAPREAGTPAGVAWTVYSKEATEWLARRAKEEKTIANIHLLFCLHRAVCELGLTSNEVPAWLIPVNLRGAVRLERSKANHSSFITLAIPREATAVSVSGILREQLRRDAHIGAWVAMNLGKILGRERYRKRTHEMMARPFGWTGGFTNLGVWPFGTMTLPAAASDPWIGCPPVSRKVPLGAGCIVWNGRFALGAQLHPCLGVDAEMATTLVRRFNTIALAGFEGTPVSVGFTPDSELRASPKLAP